MPRKTFIVRISSPSDVHDVYHSSMMAAVREAIGCWSNLSEERKRSTSIQVLYYEGTEELGDDRFRDTYQVWFDAREHEEYEGSMNALVYEFACRLDEFFAEKGLRLTRLGEAVDTEIYARYWIEDYNASVDVDEEAGCMDDLDRVWEAFNSWFGIEDEVVDGEYKIERARE